MQDSNIGINGVPSIRLGGSSIENLPIAEAFGVKEQIPISIETERQNKIGNIKARYPKANVAWIESRIKECLENIEKIQNFRSKQMVSISDYTSQLAMCKYREGEIEQIVDDDPDRAIKIRDLKKRFPPYDVEAMKIQIVQFEEGCQRCDSVIKQEHDSIAELSEVLGRCKQRDLEIKRLGG